MAFGSVDRQYRGWEAMEDGEAKVRAAFSEHFGGKAEVVASAPGRVNLIGEHTDYNEGFVFPMAIERRIWVAGRRSGNGRIALRSLNGLPPVDARLDRLEKMGTWADYPLGVAHELQSRGFELGGFEAVCFGSVPIGSGLSSSAALEVAFLYLLMELFKLEIPPKDRPLICHSAETNFVGVKCGIMDQFICALGQKDHALFLDCRTIEYRQVPLKLGTHVVAVVDSKKKRGLVDSEYNRRRAECEEGVRILQALGYGSVKALRDVSLELLEANREHFPETVFRRCRHVVTENARVLSSVEALERGDLETFGHYLNASHDSLRDDYEVSCDELDLLVETARSTPGVLGSRLTGAGFGGCTVTLVREDALPEMESRLRSRFAERFGYEPEVMVTRASAGAWVRKLG